MAEVGKVEVGNRVRLNIKLKRRWVPAMRKAVNGAVGRVEQINPFTGEVLVRLDTSPAPWAGNPSPGNGYWVSTDDLAPMAGSSA